MKNSLKNQFGIIGTISAAMLALGACDLREKSENTAKDVTNAAAKAVDSCESYNTDSEADAKNDVSLAPAAAYKFDLYWLGRDSKLTLWENDVANDFYSVSFSPLVIKSLDNRTQQVRDEDNCLESKAKAGDCIERFEEIMTMIDEAKESYKNAGVELSKGKEMTYRCTRAFSEKKITELKAFQTQQ